MDKIQLLPDSVANQIAAGEVIQRPASVIKELVENAVDAGAKTIKVVVRDAGRTLIQVIDDGCGMSMTDARLAFERHATSKIKNAEDLFSLTTMGFRGEALPSIVAVAQVKLITRREVDELGTCVTISGSRFESQEPVTCAVGSNFSVENLFFNVPARRRFLKSNTTELNNVISAFLRIALVYPEISFILYNNVQEVYNLKATTMHQRIHDVFGKKLNQDLLPIDVETTVCGIKGFVGKPESAHKKGVQQYFFVNGRYMKHAYFHKAVMAAFERLVPTGEQVPYFIYFTIKPEDIDVNIHPTKTEIKFQDENVIWQILSAAVREAVGRFNQIPSIDFDTEGKPDIPLFDESAEPVKPHTGFDPSYNPFKPAHAAVSSRINVVKSAIPKDWESLYAGLETGDAFSSRPLEQQLFEEQPVDSLNVEGTNSESSNGEALVIEDKSPSHYQYKGQYIMSSVKTGLMIIDQHRAHSRILYEQYMKRMKDNSPHSQKVLFPEVIQLQPAEMTMASVVIPELERLGFELSDLGGGAYAVNAVPDGTMGIDISVMVKEMIASAVAHEGMNAGGLPGSIVPASDEMYSSMAISMARSAAIPYGQVLTEQEMDNIVNELFACSNFNYTPDGKKVLTIIKHTDITPLFK